MSINKILVTAALASAGALGVGAAQAQGVDVQWSVTLGTPIYAQPAPVYTRPAPGYWQPFAWYPQRGYRQPTRWDRDGDGIPNRYDRHDDRGGRDEHGHDGRDWNDGRGGNDGRGSHDGRSGNDGRGAHDVHAWQGR